MHKWYVIYTKANNELLAIKKLKKENYNVYCPMYLSVVKHARKIRKILKPFFPGYLFIRLDIEKDSWISINYMIGVKKLLDDGKFPIALDQGIIDEILSLQNNQGFIDNVELDLFKINQEVIVNDGPFQGLKGTFKGLSAGQRVEVLLNMLGRKLTVKFNSLQISAI